jgi:hypothetical protein
LSRLRPHQGWRLEILRWLWLRKLPRTHFQQDRAHTDVEGCCWYGRGVIQTSGICNFGKLNFFLGKRGKDEGRSVLYPDIDFCKDPEAICKPEPPPALKWIAGFFYWLNSVQSWVRRQGRLEVHGQAQELDWRWHGPE